MADFDVSNFDFSGTPSLGELLDKFDIFAAEPVDAFDVDALI